MEVLNIYDSYREALASCPHRLAVEHYQPLSKATSLKLKPNVITKLTKHGADIQIHFSLKSEGN